MSLLSALYSRFWYYANQEKRIASTKKWKKAHPDKVRGYNKIWRERYPEKARLSRKLWKKRHPEKVREQHRRRMLKPNCYADKLALNARRRAKLKITTSLPKIKQIYRRCQELRQWFNVVVDHKLPLSKGGLHSANNLQIIYAHENARKHNNPNYRPLVIFN